MKRRAAVEPGIGQLKREHRIDRSLLKGKEGDRINATLSAAEINFSKLFRWGALFLSGFLTVKECHWICPLP